jgi:hypothetical protein
VGRPDAPPVVVEDRPITCRPIPTRRHA